MGVIQTTYNSWDDPPSIYNNESTFLDVLWAWNEPSQADTIALSSAMSQSFLVKCRYKREDFWSRNVGHVTSYKWGYNSMYRGEKKPVTHV